jgi:uncharacterized protein
VTGQLPSLGILPVPPAVGAPFWEGARVGELRLQRCSQNGHFWHPPGAVCPICHTSEYEWVVASGHGRVYSWTTIHHAVHTAVIPWLPYTIVLVDLDEGPRLISLYHGRQDPVIGESVAVRFEPYSEVVLPVFAPVADQR